MNRQYEAERISRVRQQEWLALLCQGKQALRQLASDDPRAMRAYAKLYPKCQTL